VRSDNVAHARAHIKNRLVFQDFFAVTLARAKKLLRSDFVPLAHAKSSAYSFLHREPSRLR
jgi:hypothetical protein